MGILYRLYFGRQRLLRSSDVEENPGQRISHRSCRFAYANIRGLHKNVSDLSLTARGRDVVFYCKTLVSTRSHISEINMPGFGRPMQLPKGEVDMFRGLAVYVPDGFSAYRQCSYECGCYEVIVVGICSNSHNFYALACTGILIYRVKFFTFVDDYG